MPISNLGFKDACVFLVTTAISMHGQVLLAQSTARSSGESSTRSVIQYAERFSGNTAGEQINAAIVALSGRGGIVDARNLDGGEIRVAVVVPAHTEILLNPNAVYICTVASGPCWAITGPGGKILGGSVSFALGAYSPATQTGTVLRMGKGTTDMTDMIAMNPTPKPYNPVGGMEVGNLTIDNTPNASRHCIVTRAIMHSYIHDIQCYGGMDGFEFETSENGYSYDNRLSNLLAQAVAGADFNFTTATGSGFADLDRWICDLCKAGSQGTNNYGFAFTTGTGGQQTIADMEFRNAWVAGTAAQCTSPCTYPAGIFFHQQGSGATPYIERVSFTGEIEQFASKGRGKEIELINAGPPAAVQDLRFDVIEYGWGSEIPDFNGASLASFQYRTTEMNRVIQPQTFATLPRCASGPGTQEGAIATITDATTNAWGANVTSGGGDNNVMVRCNGRFWTVTGK
jgi:hypothetical protein